MHYTGTLKSNGSKFDSSLVGFVFYSCRFGIPLTDGSFLCVHVAHAFSISLSKIYCFHILQKDRRKPFVTQIGVGRVIRGWDEGVPQMSLGEKAKLIISSDFGYGDRGFPPVVSSSCF